MRAVAAVLVAVLALGTPAPALAYLKFGVRIGANVVDVRWNGPVPYFVNERSIQGISGSDLRDVVERSFATWGAVSTADVHGEFQGFTTAPPGLQDRRTTFGFLDRPDLDRVLGATNFLLDATTGEIQEADVFFNTRFDWSLASGGEAGRMDLQSVVLHETGHLLGLGHSALGETEITTSGRRVLGSGAVMFPIAFVAGSIADRVLQPDDIAGITDLYPAAGAAQTLSSISGRVTKNGVGLFGAHVVAANLTTGALVGGFTLDPGGGFVIAGVEPGAYVLRVEPLDDADIESFLSGDIDIDFGITYAPRVVIAPEGGGSEPAVIEVRPK